MHFFKNITVCFKACIALSAVCILVPVLLDAQQDSLSKPKKKIKIHNSDRTRIIESDSGSVYRFNGNVTMEHNNAIMHCDSAIMYPSNFFEAMGRTRVTSGTTSVSGDNMTYDGKLAIVRGRVVYLTDGSSTLRTSKVDFDTETETGFFENGGTIIDSARLLESQKGYYYSKIKEFEFIGKVESDAKKYLLRSDSMKYNTDTKIFTFYLHTHIWSDNGYLYADKGWFDSEKNIMFFYRNSYILSPKQEIFADSVYYESVDKKGKLYSNVQIADTVKNTIAVADFADFNMNTEDFIMRKNPSVIMFDDKDTTFMRADTIFSVNISVTSKTVDTLNIGAVSDSTISNRINTLALRDSLQNTELNPFDSLKIQPVVDSTIKMPDLQDLTQNMTTKDTLGFHQPDTSNIKPVVDSSCKELYAFKNVKLFRKDFQLICDSLFFSSVDSIWKVYKKPVVWDGKKMQITSDSMKFFIHDGDLKRSLFNGSAMIISPEGEPDAARYFDQIKAKNIEVLFKNRKMHILNAVGNLQTIAFSLSELTMNKTEAASMRMIFDSLGKLRTLGYYESIQGDNNPIVLVREEDIRLQGFASKFDLRPLSGSDVLNRDIRPTERAERESIPKPVFPITAKIDKREAELKQGISVKSEEPTEPVTEILKTPEKIEPEKIIDKNNKDIKLKIKELKDIDKIQ